MSSAKVKVSKASNIETQALHTDTGNTGRNGHNWGEGESEELFGPIQRTSGDLQTAEKGKEETEGYFTTIKTPLANLC